MSGATTSVPDRPRSAMLVIRTCRPFIAGGGTARAILRLLRHPRAEQRERGRPDMLAIDDQPVVAAFADPPCAERLVERRLIEVRRPGIGRRPTTQAPAGAARATPGP